MNDPIDFVLGSFEGASIDGATADRLADGMPGVTLFREDLGAVRQLVARAFDVVLVDDHNLHVATHDDLFTGLIGKQVRVLEHDLAVLRRFKERLLTTLSNTADVERPHRQLRARFTDGLRGDDADSFTDVDRRTSCKVTAITSGADTVIRFTSQR